jgi:hypothetical protein
MLSEQYRLAAKEWCELDAAANILEETKSAVLSSRMVALGDMPVSKAEMQVKASDEWREFIESMVTSRKEANLAKVKCEWLRMRFQEWSSQQANERAEKRL